MEPPHLDEEDLESLGLEGLKKHMDELEQYEKEELTAFYSDEDNADGWSADSHYLYSADVLDRIAMEEVH